MTNIKESHIMGNIIEYGDVTDALSIDSTQQPLNHFAQGFTLNPTEWTEHEDFRFHVSKSYARWANGSQVQPYNGRTYCYELALVPPDSYIAHLIDSMAGLYSLKVDEKSRIVDGSRSYNTENDFFTYEERRNANQESINGYAMKPEMELEFIANYKEVNAISDDDFQYMPLYFVESINGLFSRNLQRLEWAKATNDTKIKGKQLNQFIADFIFSWNNPLIGYKLNEDTKLVPTRTTASNSVTNIQF